MAVCAKCKRPLPNNAKACYFCGKLTPDVAPSEKKEVPAPKRSADEAIFATTTASMAQRKGAGKTIVRVILAVAGLVALFFLGKEAMVLFDGSGEEYRQEIFYDPVSGLLWQRSKVDPMTYEDGSRYCERSRLGAMEDWRLPSIEELRTIVSGCMATVQSGTCQIRDDCLSRQCRVDECAGCGAGAGPGEEGFYWERGIWKREFGATRGEYWSSSVVKDGPGDEVWAVSFVSGGIVAKERGTGGETRCVSGPVPVTDRLKQYFIFLQ